MMYYGPGMGGWMMVLMMFGNVLFWTVLILSSVMIGRLLRRDSVDDFDSTEAAPQQLLAERFARGEITENDYRHSLRVLSDTASPSLR